MLTIKFCPFDVFGALRPLDFQLAGQLLINGLSTLKHAFLEYVVSCLSPVRGTSKDTFLGLNNVLQFHQLGVSNSKNQEKGYLFCSYLGLKYLFRVR